MSLCLKTFPILHFRRLYGLLKNIRSPTSDLDTINIVTSESDIIPVDRCLLGIVSPLLPPLLSNALGNVPPTIFLSDFSTFVVKQFLEVVTHGVITSGADSFCQVIELARMLGVENFAIESISDDESFEVLDVGTAGEAEGFVGVDFDNNQTTRSMEDLQVEPTTRQTFTLPTNTAAMPDSHLLRLLFCLF